jgi:selenocysteine lyase/cysteine desulfurase
MTNPDQWRRAEFPLLSKKTYLNTGSYAALSTSVEASVHAYLESRQSIGADWDFWVQKTEAVRARLAVLLNAATDEIAVTASASASINSLASAIDFSGRRSRVIVSDFEFPTNAQIWHAQERRGARVCHVSPNVDGYITAEQVDRAIDDETKLVAITHVCYRNGMKLDIAEISRVAHAKGAWVMIDAYQSVGAESLDVSALGVDFVVGGTLKYLLGTAGVGFLYVSRKLIGELVPTASGWFAQEDIQAMDISANRPAGRASRFEAGAPAVVNAFATAAGLDVVLGVGTPAISERIRDLTRQCLSELSRAGISVATPMDDNRRGPTIAIRSSNDRALVAALLKRNIVTSCRDGNVRASFHFYNNEDDIAALVLGLLNERELLVLK